jgi:hypothetical protein
MDGFSIHVIQLPTPKPRLKTPLLNNQLQHAFFSRLLLQLPALTFVIAIPA